MLPVFLGLVFISHLVPVQTGALQVWASKLERGPSAAGQPRRVSRFGPQNLERRPVRPDGPEGFLVWSSKPGGGARRGRAARPVSWFGPQNQGRGLSEAKRPKDVPRHVPELVSVVWPQNHHRRGFSGFDSKPGSAPGLTRRPGGHLAHTRRMRGGEERTPITRGRPMG